MLCQGVWILLNNNSFNIRKLVEGDEAFSYHVPDGLNHLGVWISFAGPPYSKKMAEQFHRDFRFFQAKKMTPYSSLILVYKPCLKCFLTVSQNCWLPYILYMFPQPTELTESYREIHRQANSKDRSGHHTDLHQYCWDITWITNNRLGPHVISPKCLIQTLP